ncbi:MAG: SDR family oxidoreductase, partial [Micrococcales bacterium]|nr:SDR family oxidoreductase [Micrococcales bacterium]
MGGIARYQDGGIASLMNRVSEGKLKGKMEKKVAELVEPLNPSLFLPCNVENDEQIQSTFETIRQEWGRLDILVHCLAFA